MTFNKQDILDAFKRRVAARITMAIAKLAMKI